MRFWHLLIPVLALGCSHLVPTPTTPVPGGGTRTYTFKQIDKSSLPKLISVKCVGTDVFASYANVYHGSNKSEIRRNGSKVYSDGSETRALWTNGSDLYATGEHSTHALKWNGSGFVFAAGTRGRWSITGFETFSPYNNTYGDPELPRDVLLASIRDPALFIDVNTAAVHHRSPANNLPRSIVRLSGRMCYSGNFGEDTLCVEKSPNSRSFDKYASPALTLCVFGNRLYGGGGMRAGPSEHKQADGKLYRWESGSNWTTLHDTGCYEISDVIVLSDCVLWIGTDPDKVVEMSFASDGSPVFRDVFARGSDAGQRDRDFGGAGDARDDSHAFVGFSDKGNYSVLYEVEIKR